ncbi:hypothetical protein DIZ81_05830 [Legionella taurinensis]|uniref:Uncharacterized protein n=2 Tax=Legionella taurinensis TaxID=70611 RepID=A0A3A5L5C2_9GAMM|nr:hypothetical protein DB744_05830 [Legionella taurinensis]PUT44202.1 hypothetical protein DB746_04230 [Legionella taurinensis]PUT47503.1 hypothetical protein DB743_02400 [Legionella taurinensis]PUT48642.1 hypothetical protein DB745_04230 [Legionella taurinensis]RJT48008.1 hypothetical protein D6J04_05425 [Legionella taurinensis]
MIKDEEESEKEYSNFLSAKAIILAYDSVTEIPEKLAEARIAFVHSLFTMSDSRFEQAAKTLPDLGDILSAKHRQTLRELINTKAANHLNAARAERLFLATEERIQYYRKKYDDFIAERKKEIETNNQRSQIQFLLLEYGDSGMDKCLNMSVAETSEVKLTRATRHLKDTYGIELHPLQFRDNLQSYGANLVNFYDLLNSARKSVADYYPPEYQKEFEVFYKAQEERLFPDPRVARSIAAVKIVAAYQENKIDPAHPDYPVLCKEMESCLESTPLDVCLAYIKKKDEPAEAYFKESLDTLYQLIREYHDNTVPCTVAPDQLARSFQSLATLTNKPPPQFLNQRPGNNSIPARENAETTVTVKSGPLSSEKTPEPPPEKLTPVAKTPSLSNLEQKRKPLPPLPKSYSANDVVTIAPVPDSPSANEKPSVHHANHSLHFFQKKQMLAEVLAKNPPPVITRRPGMGRGYYEK